MPSRSGRWRAVATRFALLASSLCATALLLEALMRLVPAALPSGVYSLGQRFDEGVQSAVYTGAVVYNKARRSVRHPNTSGFMDVEHARAPDPGVRRVGFFGDSYVESVQVALEDTFFRRLARDAEPQHLEVLAFGISGWGTLHSLLAYRDLAPRFELDELVYVFVENDPGDNAWSIQRAHRANYLRRPFALLDDAPPGFRLRWIEGLDTHRLARWVRAFYDRSLLARLVWSRVLLLRSYGAGRDRAADAEMMGAAGAIPDQNDLPSTWPPAYTEEARELGRRILAVWLQETRREGRGFSVLYVPRSEAQLRGELPDRDTWKPWLLETCAELGIPLIDPTPELRAALEAGDSVYDDHWTPAGHAAVAAALERAWLPRAAEAAGRAG